MKTQSVISERPTRWIASTQVMMMLAASTALKEMATHVSIMKFRAIFSHQWTVGDRKWHQLDRGDIDRYAYQSTPDGLLQSR